MTWQSFTLVLGLIASILTIIGGEAGVFPPSWHPYLILAGAVGLGITTWLAKSPANNGAGPGAAPSASSVSRSTTAKLGAVLLLVCLGGLALPSCSSNPQVNLLHGSQSATTSLGAFQQIENAICGVDATVPTHCDNTIPGVSGAALDKAHQSIEAAIGKFATDKIAFDQAAAAYQPGQGAPTSLAALTADGQLILTTVQGLPQTSQTAAAIQSIQAVLTLLTNLASQFTSAPSASAAS